MIHAHGIVYCKAYHHVLEPEHWFDEALAYWDTDERVGDQWLFRRRRLRSWYRHHTDHPELGGAPVEATAERTGPKRGERMPEAFATFDAFWRSEPLG